MSKRFIDADELQNSLAEKQKSIVKDISYGELDAESRKLFNRLGKITSIVSRAKTFEPYDYDAFVKWCDWVSDESTVWSSDQINQLFDKFYLVPKE